MSLKGKGKGKSFPPRCPPAFAKASIKGTKKGKDLFTGPVRRWPPVFDRDRHDDFVQQRAFALPVEEEVFPSFESLRRLVAGVLYVGVPLVDRNQMWGHTPRRLVDTMLPHPAALEAAVAALGQIANSTGIVASAYVKVHVDRLGGTPLHYTVAADDTCATLKTRIADKLGVPAFMIILLLGPGPFHLVHDVPLSAYCSSSDAELRLTLVVSLRDVCVIASRGDSEEKAANALSVLMKRACPGDELKIDAAHDCIGNSDWDSPLILPALHVLRKVLPPDMACTFFAACVGCVCPRNGRLMSVYGADALCQLQEDQGHTFVSSCLTHCKEVALPVDGIHTFLRQIVDRTGPVHKFSTCVKAPVAAPIARNLLEVTSAHLASYLLSGGSAVSMPHFRAVIDFEDNIAKALLDLAGNPACYDEIAKRYPVIHQALLGQQQALGLSLQEVVSNLHITFEDKHGYPASKHTEKAKLHVVMQHSFGLSESAAVVGSGCGFKNDATVLDTGVLCTVAMMQRIPAEHVRLALEALSVVAPPGDRDALKVACLASTHRDASVREQALELLLPRAVKADLEYVIKFLENRRDTHANRILQEIVLSSQY